MATNTHVKANTDHAYTHSIATLPQNGSSRNAALRMVMKAPELVYNASFAAQILVASSPDHLLVLPNRLLSHQDIAGALQEGLNSIARWFGGKEAVPWVIDFDTSLVIDACPHLTLYGNKAEQS